MITAIIAAGLLALIQNGPSNTPFGELADELEATGVIRCPMTSEEEALNTVSRSRLDHISDLFGGYAPDRRVFGCSVIRLQVAPTGRVRSIQAIRYRGGSSLEDKASHFHFKPSDREWTALLSINAGAAPEERAKAAKDLREMNGYAAQKPVPGALPPN